MFHFSPLKFYPEDQTAPTLLFDCWNVTLQAMLRYLMTEMARYMSICIVWFKIRAHDPNHLSCVARFQHF